MAFLDNSGDIVLDTIITDAGRMRLAQGNFKITKFSLGDEEINYALYNYNHSSGSAYYDLEILQSPVLESFTNNTSNMNSHLITIPRNNLLYLPVIKINEVASAGNAMHSGGSFYCLVNKETEDAFAAANVTTGVMRGENLGGSSIRLDQGLDTTEVSYALTLDSDLVETQYIIEMDSKFFKLVSTSGTVAKVSYIDDDSIASYYVSLGTDVEFVTENTNKTTSTGETIAGPRGTTLQFRLQSSLELNTSDFLFQQLGTTDVAGNNAAFGIAATALVEYIDSYIKVTGGSTGSTLFIPVRAIKIQ